MHFPTKLGTRLALFCGRDLSGQSMHLPSLFFSEPLNDKMHLPRLFCSRLLNETRCAPGQLVLPRCLPGQGRSGGWAGRGWLPAASESRSRPRSCWGHIRLVSWQLEWPFLFCWRYIWTDCVSRYWKPDQLHLAHLLLTDLVVRVRDEVLPHLWSSQWWQWWQYCGNGEDDENGDNDVTMVAISWKMMTTLWQWWRWWEWWQKCDKWWQCPWCCPLHLSEGVGNAGVCLGRGSKSSDLYMQVLSKVLEILCFEFYD